MSAPDLAPPTVRAGAPRESNTPPGTLPLGTQLAGRYRLLELLGRGGMGVVYRARDLALDLDIAVKVLHPDVADDAERLAFVRNEVRVARMVTHPNVCRLHDLVETESGSAITMEHVAGESLAERLRRGPMPLAEAVRVLREVAAGLAAAHAAGVVHRDLKPSNVLLAADRALILDFGIAAERSVLAAGPQGVAGTTGYMAPEQALGGTVDARADVYAFGVLACVLATGRRPPPSVPTQSEVAGGSAAALPVDDIAPYVEALPPALGALILDCLALAPDARPADAAAVLARLPAVAAPRARRRWPLALAAAALALVAILLGTRAEAPAHPPRFAIPPLAATGLGPAEAWQAAALQHLVARELVDAYGIEARPVAAGAALGAGWQALPGSLAREPNGTLHARLGALEASGTAPRALARDLVKQLVARTVPPAHQHPTAAELRVAGTAQPEAWRLWRRAQRESLLQRWSRATQLCDEALALDSRFPLAALERAQINDNKDAVARRQLTEAIALFEGVPVRPIWRASARIAEQLMADDPAGAEQTYRVARAGDMDARERHYGDVRFVFAQYYSGSQKAAVPALEQLTEAYPDDASAFKLLASYHLASDEPTSAALALRYATRAVALAPDDAAARTDLALALLQTGDAAAARARKLELDAAEPDDKRLASARLFTLHLALDDPAAAEVDARRLLSGTAVQQAEGHSRLATLDLYWGRVEAGVRGLVATADAFDGLGHTVSAARLRVVAARHALAIGDRATARAQLALVAAGPTSQAPLAGVLERLAAGAVAEARSRTRALPADSLDRAAAELAIAEAAGDHAAVLAAYARVERLSASVRFLPAVAAALAATNRPDAALAAYLRVARAPHIEPFASGRAWYQVGLLRARAGDRAGAQAALAEVIARWDRATTALPEVADARRRLRAAP